MGSGRFANESINIARVVGKITTDLMAVPKGFQNTFTEAWSIHKEWSKIDVPNPKDWFEDIQDSWNSNPYPKLGGGRGKTVRETAGGREDSDQ